MGTVNLHVSHYLFYSSYHKREGTYLAYNESPLGTPSLDIVQSLENINYSSSWIILTINILIFSSKI